MEKPKIGIVISTTRPGRIGPKIAQWYLDQVTSRDDAEFELIDLKEYALPFLDEPEMPGKQLYELESTKQWSRVVDGLDGFVFVVAEYNNGYPAPLKNAIDTIYKEWNNKPVAFIGYGSIGGARAIEQLIPVTVKIDMIARSRTAIKLLDPRRMWEGDQIKAEHMRGNVQSMTDDLVWWTKFLRAAR